jgi:hypothetical protein
MEMDMEYGLSDGLVDGICVCYVLVKAAPDQIVACYGKPQPIYHKGKLHVAQWPDEAIASAGKPVHSDWSIVEIHPSLMHGLPQFDSGTDNPAPGSEEDDYLVLLFQQAIAAMRFSVPDVAELYETPVTTAGRLSKKLSSPAIALWGSDEAGPSGGVIFDAQGNIEKVYNEYPLADTIRFVAERKRATSDGNVEIEDVDDDQLFSGAVPEGDFIFEFRPGRAAKIVKGDVINIFDKIFKSIKAYDPAIFRCELSDVGDLFDDYWSTVAS